MSSTTPVRESHMVVQNKDSIGYSNRILIGTPSRGTVRMEWHSAVRSMLVPPNWGQVSMDQRMSTLAPVRFQVADAQNIIVRELIMKDFEWLLLLEDDVIPPNNLLTRLNEYMREGKVPVVSGLYYTKSEPSEPLIYRGRGTGSFLDWKLGEKVWADGVPTGCLLVHQSLLKTMWSMAEAYDIGGQTTRRVFDSGRKSWVDPDTGTLNTQSGTSDLDWCQRVKEQDLLAKSGWSDYEGCEHPFLVDTSIQCYHTTLDGQVFPPQPFGSS